MMMGVDGMTKEKVKCKCCGNIFEARTADIKRGWGKYCSKSCKAKKQESRTGQFKNFQNRLNWDKEIFIGYQGEIV